VLVTYFYLTNKSNLNDRLYKNTIFLSFDGGLLWGGHHVFLTTT